MSDPHGTDDPFEEVVSQREMDNPATDPLFPDPPDDQPSAQGIFANKELLRVGYVPEGDRIVGRDEEIRAVADEIGVVVNDEPTNHVSIFGKTGTGKSLVARHVTQRAEQTAAARGTDVATVYVDCSASSSPTKASKAIARSLNQNYEFGLNIPRRGIGADDYYTYLWEDLLPNFDHAIVILDEVDMLDEVDADANPNDEYEGVLNQLSRANEFGKTDCKIGIVTISNKVRYQGHLSKRVESSFSPEDFVFSPYDAVQLRKILENRKDAFHDDVLDNGVIEKCAALSAQEHGDARKAIVVLRAAGEAAERNGERMVTEDHIKEAADYAEVDRIRELMQGNTPQAKAVLYTLGALHILHQDEDADDAAVTTAFRTRQIHEWYERVCDAASMNALTYNRVYGLLREQRFLEIVESQKTDGDRKNSREHWLMVKPEFAIHAVIDDLDQSLATPEELRERRDSGEMSSEAEQSSVTAWE